jgi:hypothetical protein
MRFKVRIVSLLLLIASSACAGNEGREDDPRCEDPRIGSAWLDVLDFLADDQEYPTADAEPIHPEDASGAIGGICDGSLDIKLVGMSAPANP